MDDNIRFSVITETENTKRIFDHLKLDTVVCKNEEVEKTIKDMKQDNIIVTDNLDAQAFFLNGYTVEIHDNIGFIGNAVSTEDIGNSDIIENVYFVVRQ